MCARPQPTRDERDAGDDERRAGRARRPDALLQDERAERDREEDARSRGPPRRSPPARAPARPARARRRRTSDGRCEASPAATPTRTLDRPAAATCQQRCAATATGSEDEPQVRRPATHARSPPCRRACSPRCSRRSRARARRRARSMSPRSPRTSTTPPPTRSDAECLPGAERCSRERGAGEDEDRRDAARDRVDEAQVGSGVRAHAAGRSRRARARTRLRSRAARRPRPPTSPARRAREARPRARARRSSWRGRRGRARAGCSSRHGAPRRPVRARARMPARLAVEDDRHRAVVHERDARAGADDPAGTDVRPVTTWRPGRPRSSRSCPCPWSARS